MLHPLQTPAHIDDAVSRLRTLLDVLNTKPTDATPPAIERYAKRLGGAWDAFRAVFGKMEKGEKPVNDRDNSDNDGIADADGLKSLLDRSNVESAVRRGLKAIVPAYQSVTACLNQARDHGIDNSPFDNACQKIEDLISLMKPSEKTVRHPAEPAASFSSAIVSLRELIEAATKIRDSWHTSVDPAAFQSLNRKQRKSPTGEKTACCTRAVPLPPRSAEWITTYKERLQEIETRLLDQFWEIRASAGRAFGAAVPERFSTEVRESEIAARALTNTMHTFTEQPIADYSDHVLARRRALDLVNDLHRNWVPILAGMETPAPAEKPTNPRGRKRTQTDTPPEIDALVMRLHKHGGKYGDTLAALKSHTSRELPVCPHRSHTEVYALVQKLNEDDVERIVERNRTQAKRIAARQTKRTR